MKLSSILKTKEKIKKQIDVANTIIKKLASDAKSPETIIAGGAPRNWSFGMPANDLDIYISDKDCIVSTINKLFPNSQQTEEPNSSDYLGENKYNGINDIVNVIKCKIKGMNVQFIIINSFHKTPKSFAKQVFSSYDFGICKIAQTADIVIKSKEFTEDKKNKTITIDIKNVLKNSKQIDNLPNRCKKMKKYFPDHEIVIV